MIFQLETFPLLVSLCFVTEIHQTHFQCIKTLTFFTIKKFLIMLLMLVLTKKYYFVLFLRIQTVYCIIKR